MIFLNRQVRILVLAWSLVGGTGHANPIIELPNNTLQMASTEWCPYVCEQDKNGKGLAYDYLAYVLKSANIQLDVEFMPWARAIQQAKLGKKHGLLTAIVEEAPELSFTTTATMDFQMCFFGLASDSWRYTGLSSLSKRRLGIVNGYGYGEPIDSYIDSNRGAANLIELTGDAGLIRLVKMIELGRLDTFIDDPNVVAWQQKKAYGVNVKISQHGCLQAYPFYMALSPNLPGVERLLTWLDHALASKSRQAHLNTVIKPKYLGDD